jgi:hypothetical protein
MTVQQLRTTRLCSQPLLRLAVLQVKQEWEVHASLSHPNIIQAYLGMEDSSGVKLFMEYAGDSDAYSYINAKQRLCLREDDARQLVYDVLTALQYMHNQVCAGWGWCAQQQCLVYWGLQLLLDAQATCTAARGWLNALRMLCGMLCGCTGKVVCCVDAASTHVSLLYGVRSVMLLRAACPFCTPEHAGADRVSVRLSRAFMDCSARSCMCAVCSNCVVGCLITANRKSKPCLTLPHRAWCCVLLLLRPGHRAP